MWTGCATAHSSLLTALMGGHWEVCVDSSCSNCSVWMLGPGLLLNKLVVDRLPLCCCFCEWFRIADEYGVVSSDELLSFPSICACESKILGGLQFTSNFIGSLLGFGISFFLTLVTLCAFLSQIPLPKCYLSVVWSQAFSTSILHMCLIGFFSHNWYLLSMVDLVQVWRIGIHKSGREWRSLHAGVRILGRWFWWTISSWFKMCLI